MRRPLGHGRRVCAQDGRDGFTLLEVVLTFSLVALLAGLAVVSFSGVLESNSRKECSFRLASLLRAARAEAANTGRRLRLSFDAESSQPLLAIEPDPLGEPGTFRPCRASWVELVRVGEGVSVVSCELTGASAFADLTTTGAGSPDEGEAALAEVTFYPDGTSDSARIVLATDDEGDPWAVEVTLNGVDGTIDTREIDLEEESTE